MDPNQRGSRTFLSAILLTVAGGYLDAYTYFVRGGVFANAQTGNVIKLGISAAEKDLSHCLYYLYPILAFIGGVLLSLVIEETCERRNNPYPRRIILGIEILFMIMIAFIPVNETATVIANIMVSFLCAMQMQTFQIFNRQGMATTVATGNLRKAAECLYLGIRSRDTEQLKISLSFFAIIFLFISGVIAGTLFSKLLSARSILIPAGLLMTACAHITAVYSRFSRTNMQ